MSYARWIAGALVAATLALYAWRLDRAPVHIGGDEAQFAVHAHAIATTGRDLNGTRWPLFVKITDLLVPNHSSRIWYQPALFYLMAIELRFLPFNETSVRLPTVLIAGVNVLLAYLVGVRLLSSRGYALLAAAALAMTPAHFLLARQALDYICPLPIILAWLWCVIEYQRTRKTAMLVLTGLLLGAGMFTYIASWATMPLLAALTLIVLRPPWRAAAAAAAAMLAPIAMVMPVLWSQPEMLADTLGRYRLGAQTPATPPASILDANLAERVTLYWDYFNPSFLFVAGGSNPTMATRQVGVFLLPVAVFLCAGIYALWRQRTPAARLLLAAFIVSPLPVVVTMSSQPEYSIARALPMVPLAMLIAAAGMQQLFSSGRPALRLACIVLLAVMPWQFAGFLRDYFADYQVRSATRFDPVATREVMARIDELDRAAAAPQILFNADLDDRSVRWRFHTVKLGRLDLWERARSFDANQFEPAAVPAGSLLVLYANDHRVEQIVATGTCAEVARINGVGGEPSAVILRRL